jgi:mannose-1-phosphate guanylyltransferase
MNKKKLVSGFITKKGFTDIGNKESYKQASQEYNEKFRKSGQ